MSFISNKEPGYYTEDNGMIISTSNMNIFAKDLKLGDTIFPDEGNYHGLSILDAEVITSMDMNQGSVDSMYVEIVSIQDYLSGDRNGHPKRFSLYTKLSIYRFKLKDVLDKL